MDVLKELLDNARKLLGQMSSTQRASIVTMIITVSSLLVLIVWLGSIGEKKTNVPLPITIPLKDSETYKKMLEDKGITGVGYDDVNQLLLVPPEKRSEAMAILAVNNAIPETHGDGFEKMLEKTKFTDSGIITAEKLRVALQNEVARMVEAIDGVERAEVIYTSAERKPLFRAPYRQRAAVKVTMKMGRNLNQPMADAIIALVTFARSGLDEKDVVVTDQKGSHFRNDDENAIGKIAFKGQELNLLTSERARRDIEACVRLMIPSSEVYAWVDTKWNMDQKTVHREEILQGMPTLVTTRKIADHSSDRPSNVVGVNPNVSRSTNMNGGGNGREVARDFSRSEKDTRFENGKEMTNLTVAPVISSQTAVVVVHLPPQRVLDKSGKPVYELGQDGKPLPDVNGNPKIKMVSMGELKGAQLTALERSVRKAAGMLDGAQNMEVEISQVPWMPDLEGDKSPDKEDSFRRLLSENVASIFMMGILLVALFFVYRLAKRSIPAEEIELPDSADFGNLFAPAHLSDQDRAQADFEQMRDQVGDFIEEDPAKAASIIRRWMVTRESY